jgi:hypothetical protein
MSEPESEKKAPKSYEVLGVEMLTKEETLEMSHITANMLFKDGYHKSDAVVDLIKLFKFEDNTENRRFALSMMTFGAAAESASSKLDRVMECLGMS